MTKGEKLDKDMKRLERLDMDMDKEGVTLKNVRGSNILGQRKHTSRGSKLMNFD
jgi:hypothetical protein